MLGGWKISLREESYIFPFENFTCLLEDFVIISCTCLFHFSIDNFFDDWARCYHASDK